MDATKTATATAEPIVKSDQTGLEKSAAKTPEVITTSLEYEQAMKKWQSQHFNVLSPFASIRSLQPGFALIPVIVAINPDPDPRKGGEVYGAPAPWVPQGCVAPAKVMLRKIAQCAAMSTSTIREDDGKTPFFWQVLAKARWRDLDGTIIERERRFEWDMRDGSPRLQGFTPKQINEARKHGLAHCEARAVNGVIREYGVKQTYTLEEIAKPFVVLRAVYLPDQSDPDVRRMMTEQFMQGTSTLYAGARPAALTSAPAIDGWASDAGDVQTEPRQVGGGPSNPTPATTAPAEPAEPAEDPNRPPTVDAVRIVKTESKSGETKGKKWTRYIIVDSTGIEHSTFDKGLYEFATKCKADNAWVEIAVSTDGNFKNLDEICIAGSQPSLPGTRDDL